MAKSVFSGIERFSTKFEDVEDGASVEAEVTVDVSVADGEAEATEIAETVAESEQVVEAVEEGENTAETLRFYADIVRKHGASPALLAVIDADQGLSNLSGIVLPSSESLDATGRNQATAEQIIQACEAAEKSVWERVKSFFRKLWESIKSLGTKILDKFSSWEIACKRSYDSIKDLSKDSIDTSKRKSIVDPAEIVKACNGFKTAIEKGTEINEVGLPDIGMKMEGDSIVNVEGTFLKAEEKEVSDTLLTALQGPTWKSVLELFKDKTRVKDAVTNAEMMCKQAITNAEKMSKLQDNNTLDQIKKDNDEKKKKLKVVTKALSVVGKIAGAYVKDCAAVRAAKKA